MILGKDSASELMKLDFIEIVTFASAAKAQTGQTHNSNTSVNNKVDTRKK